MTFINWTILICFTCNIMFFVGVLQIFRVILNDEIVLEWTRNVRSILFGSEM